MKHVFLIALLEASDTPENASCESSQVVVKVIQADICVVAGLARNL